MNLLPPPATSSHPLPPVASAARFFVAQDNDGHWYLVPVANSGQWAKWLDLPYDDMGDTPPPVEVMEIDGPHRLTFTDPREEGY